MKLTNHNELYKKYITLMLIWPHATILLSDNACIQNKLEHLTLEKTTSLLSLNNLHRVCETIKMCT